jgi:hypothetical protein
MLDFDTFLTTLYVMVDDFCKSLPSNVGPGRPTKLSLSELVTLVIVGQWRIWESERDFYSWATRHLSQAFPNLPHRSAFNRLMRANYEVIIYFFLSLASQLVPNGCDYEALDSTAIVTRNAKRRGWGHLAGLSDIGYSNRVGWYHGFHLLLSVTPQGVITGYGWGSGSSKDQKLAETFLALRTGRAGQMPSVGQAKSDYYVVDKGFEGTALRQHWQADYGAKLVGAPKRSRSQEAVPKWPKELRRWVASIRQITLTVNGKLLKSFRLESERPHDLLGLAGRLAGKVALHNFCIWLNRALGRPGLSLSELVAW